MKAHERDPEPTAATADAPGPKRSTGSGPVSMDELLASCAAADAVSRPPAAERRPARDGGPEAEAA